MNFSKTVAVLSFTALVASCGGDGESVNDQFDYGLPLGENMGDDAGLMRLRSTEELLQTLPAPDDSLASNSVTGLWLMEVSTEYQYVTEDHDQDFLIYNQGTQLALISELDEEYFVSICAAPHEATLGSEAPMVFVDGTLNFSVAKFIYGDTRFTEYTLSLQPSQLNTVINGTLEQEISATDPQATVTYMTNFAGVKLSNAENLTDAASEFDIRLSLTVNDSESDLSDMGSYVTCIGGSKGAGEGLVDNIATEHLEDFASVMAWSNERAEFFVIQQASAEKTEIYPIFYQSLVEGQGSPESYGDCEGCPAPLDASLSLLLNPESSQMSIKATGTDSDSETLAMDVYFAPL